MTALLAWDLDYTLIDTSSAKDKLPKSDKPYTARSVEENDAVFAAWDAAIVEGGLDFPVMSGAHSLVRAINAMREDWHTVVLTARRVSLKDVTRAWLEHHMPTLALTNGARPPLIMRAMDDISASHISKIARIAEYRKQFPGAPLYIVDDDPKMEDACSERRDRFVFFGNNEILMEKK